MKTSFPRYDAVLELPAGKSVSNMTLTLVLRLGMRQINPAGNAATGTYHDYGDATTGTARDIVRWQAGPWTAWKDTFKTEVETFWSNAFHLQNPGRDFAYARGDKTYAPHVQCKLRLEISDGSSSTNHHNIDVVRLAPHETWFGSHSKLYDNLDIVSTRKGRDSNGKPIMQQAHVHEVGHLIGLGHVNVGTRHCPTNSDTNAAACYGVTDEEKKSVMGQGMQVRTSHAEPWQTAMHHFTTHQRYAEIRKQSLADLARAFTIAGFGAAAGKASGAALAEQFAARWPARMSTLLPTRL